jgi:hypothetical protein
LTVLPADRLSSARLGPAILRARPEAQEMKKALCILAIIAVTGLVAVPPEIYAQGQIKGAE